MPLPSENSGADSRTMIVLSERVAVVETKITGLKDDTAVIRATLHGINSEMQRSVTAEVKCAQALESLHAVIIERGNQITQINATMDTLLAAKSTAEGSWAATVRVSGALVSSFGLLALIVGAIFWAIGHLTLH